MLIISRQVIEQLTNVFRESNQEKGFLLGCTSHLDTLDCCKQLPAIQAGLHFYEPDFELANEIVRLWANHRICFCGFIHSHVVNKPELSEADIDFARSLFLVYDLPVLWFGLALVRGENVQYRFYSVEAGKRTDIQLHEITDWSCS